MPQKLEECVVVVGRPAPLGVAISEAEGVAWPRTRSGGLREFQGARVESSAAQSGDFGADRTDFREDLVFLRLGLAENQRRDHSA